MPSFSISTLPGDMTNNIISNGENYATILYDSGIILKDKQNDRNIMTLGVGNSSFYFNTATTNTHSFTISGDGLEYKYPSDNGKFTISSLGNTGSTFILHGNSGLTYNWPSTLNFRVVPDAFSYESYALNFSFNTNSATMSYTNGMNVSFFVDPGGLHYTLGQSSNPTCMFNLNPGGTTLQFGTYYLALYGNSTSWSIESTNGTTTLKNLRFGFEEVPSRQDLSYDAKQWLNSKDDLLLALDELYTTIQDLESRVSALEGN